MKDVKATDEQFCYEVIRHYYDDVKDGREEVFRSIVHAISDYSEKHKLTLYNALVVWCEWEELPHFVADILARLHCDIYGIMSDLLAEEEALNEEAREDYNEKMRDYREMQGC